MRFSGDGDHTGHHGVALGQHSTLQFDAVVTNIGQGYDPATGLFTAPVSGVYSFFLSAMSPNSHEDLMLAIVKEGNVLDLTYGEGSTDVNDQGSSLVTTHLATGQQVWVRQNGGDSVRGSYWTVFTGYLLQADH